MALGPHVFENEVRRIARSRWPDAKYQGAGTAAVNGNEMDAILVTEDCIHLIEATTSRKQKKARDDVKQLVKEAEKRRRKNPTKAIKCWFITEHEPSNDQRREAESLSRRHEYPVVVMSLEQFSAELVDAAAYLHVRDNYPYGSVRDPESGDIEPRVAYVGMDAVEAGTGKQWDVQRISSALQSGERLLLLGDYGAGKSMTLREVHRHLSRDYRCRSSRLFPVSVNLRDHHGQSSPAEAVHRHAERIGFAPGAHLVRAWRAGQVVLLLDGFDEIATAGLHGAWKKLRDVRFRATALVRQFIADTPSGVGVVIAGRAHFFDGPRERSSSLGTGSHFKILSLSDFTEAQIGTYLSRAGSDARVPTWLPSRPLLLGHLASRGLLVDSGDPASLDDPVLGWDWLMDQVVAREARIESAVHPESLRMVLERLATTARRSVQGLGPLSTDEVTHAFATVCGYQPDENGLVLLQRLPGLGIDREEEGSRSFIDRDFADVLRAGDVAAYVRDPFSGLEHVLADAECCLGTLGAQLATHKLSSQGCTAAMITAAVRRAAADPRTQVLAADIAAIAAEGGWAIDQRTAVQGVGISELELCASEGSRNKLEYVKCSFDRIVVEPGCAADLLPRFRECYVSVIEGAVARDDLPDGVFDASCEFGDFELEAETTHGILQLELASGTAVLLTILRKLYFQSGSGREEGALRRGLDHRRQRLVDEILRMLAREGLAAKIRRGSVTIWLPQRSAAERARDMVLSPHSSHDPLMEESAQLES